MGTVKPYSLGQKMCSLCLAEKFNILTNDNNKSLNLGGEIALRCQHARATKLAAFRPHDLPGGEWSVPPRSPSLATPLRLDDRYE